MNSQSQLLGATMIGRATTDNSFYMKLPEFMPVRQKLKAMNEDMSFSHGCSKCRRKRIAGNITDDFISIVRSLSKDGRQRLKDYFGTNHLFINVVQPGTFQVKTQEI